MKASLDCHKITNYFDIDNLSERVDSIDEIRAHVNRSIGTEETRSIAPLLKRLYENAVKNAKSEAKGHRHDTLIKQFASSLVCLIGPAGYEMIQANFGCGLPHISTARRSVQKQRKIVEGEFYFNELKNHLQKWQAPLFINVQLDDTRTINKVEYDPSTDRFVGFCLPLKNGLPIGDAFQLQTFESIKTAIENETVGKYAHCIVAKSVKAGVPSFVLFSLATDAKYDHTIILKRWNHIEKGLKEIGLTVLSNGADGAGPFLKAMTIKTQLFSRAYDNTLPNYWTFFWMPKLLEDSLVCQDTVHLLAKLRTRLLTPSNLIVLGSETACRGHLEHVLDDFSKEDHGLSAQVLQNKDKQNYQSVETLLSDGVENCLKKLSIKSKIQTKGTITYLWLMRNIKEAFFNKALSPVERIHLIWQTIFFLRIWRLWLKANTYNEQDHFITQNAYVCTELNGHLLINLVHNVITGKFPKEALRVWTCGSQSCEQTFRLLRSMTSTFSTIVNFSMKGILERMHKLHYLSTVEASEEIIFPRVKRRLLQTREETEVTLQIPTVAEIDDSIFRARYEALTRARECGITLQKYGDEHLLFPSNEALIQSAVDNDHEGEDIEIAPTAQQDGITTEEAITINEDILNINLVKKRSTGVPVYAEQSDKSGRNYSLMNSLGKSQFIRYNGAFIRKSTALYLLQEKKQLSNDRLLRVRASQPRHLFNGEGERESEQQQIVRSGDLCLFRRTDSEKSLIGRIIQFSYLEGSKKERQYSSSYVDMSLDSYKKIGVFANWYHVKSPIVSSSVSFVPNETFTTGYLSMENYISSIKESILEDNGEASFTISKDNLKKIDPNWSKTFTFDQEFFDH
uniref:Uncharacterized protein n=2 Tax=Clytia hemisphaerica TaxID=252671 RepID=A0A7M5X9S7_9CNID